MPRLTHAQSANGVTREADLNRALGRFFAKICVHATLHDAEQSLCLCGSCGTAVLGCALPGNVVLLRLECILTTPRPSRSHVHRFLSAAAVGWILCAFV